MSSSNIFQDVFKTHLTHSDALLQSNKQLWSEGMKLRLLQSKQFLEWYQKPRYWMLYKPTKAGEKEVYGVKIEVSNNSFSQYSQATNSFLPCQLEYHQAVKIQTFEEYQLQLKNYDALITQLISTGQLLPDQIHKNPINNQIKLLQIEYFGLLFDWKMPASTQRIVILAKGQEYKDLNYFIYNEEVIAPQFAKAQIKIPLTVKGTSPQILAFMKQIIKIHHLKRKNHGVLQKIEHSFRQSINQSFVKAFKEHKRESARKKTKLLQNDQLKISFQQYENHQINTFVKKWKDAVQNANVNLFVQIFSIWISKSSIPVQVNLIIDGNQRMKYEYRYFENDYLIYKFIEKQKKQKIVTINLANTRIFKNINFEVEVKLKNTQTIRYRNDHTVYVLEKRENLFVQELPLENVAIGSKNQSFNDTYCIIYFNELFSRSLIIDSLQNFYETSIFNNVGHIPTKYTTTYRIDYNPKTYKTIRTLLNNQSFSTKLSKYSYQKTYYELVRFSQKEENESQRNILISPSIKVNNKFLMKQRYEMYNKKLLQGIGYFSKEENFQYFFKKNYEEITDNILNSPNITISKNQYKNFLEDLKIYKPKNVPFIKNEIIKFIYFSSKVNKMQSFPYTLRYSSHLIPIVECLFDMYLSSKKNDLGNSAFLKLQSHTDYLFTFIAFFAKLYPYSDYQQLKSDLYILRWLVQKKLPNFNDFLNRNNIGLENLISQHLLQFFTGLATELTYRIWDFLIYSEQRDQARIVVAFTLLTYFEATDTLPIIPINQFMETVESNMRKISVDKQFSAKFSKISDNFFANEQVKTSRLQKHIKGSGENSIISDRILKKIILGESKLKIPYEQQGKIPIAKTKQLQRDGNLTIKHLNYPLPEPNHQGYTIIQIILFIHDLHILENINLNSNKYWIKFYIPNTDWKEYTQIVQKNYFYNKPIKIGAPFINLFKGGQSRDKKMVAQRHIKVDIVTNVDLNSRDDSKEKSELRGFLDYSLYQKDKAYKTFINLSPESLHNKGKTILNLTLCLKTHIFNSTLPAKKETLPLQVLSEKLLDYDIGESNQCIMAGSRLATNLQRIKYPLDEFSSDQYKRIVNKALNEYESEWLQSSLTSLEELKAIFYNLFNQQKDKSLQNEFSKFYQIFAEENNMQFVYFAEMLVKFILMAKISRKKKLMYLFCTAVHYQNCYSKRINGETINSLIRLIYKQNSLVNACPYFQHTCGKVIEAYYFQSDLKSELKKDFTEIVQDWAYICNFKYGYNDIILGSARDLSILRSFFDVKTLKKMQQQKECRFEIIYEVQGFRYLWSAVVETKTFEILKRGTKFLNQFTGYSNIKYLDSTQQFLLNCQNVIPLQVHKSYSYEQFTGVMLSIHLVRYLLDYQEIYDPNSKKPEETIVLILRIDQQLKESKKKELQKELLVQGNKFHSWAICRSQNCLESWHRCNIVKPGKVISKVIFEFDQNHEYSIATLDLLAMDEVDLQPQKK